MQGLQKTGRVALVLSGLISVTGSLALVSELVIRNNGALKCMPFKRTGGQMRDREDKDIIPKMLTLEFAK